MKATNALIWGPNESIKEGKVVLEETEDKFGISTGIWPTDHKGVLITFELTK